MGKDAYIGINSKARNITNGYIGINGVARKIKKVYVGVNGVARLCWSHDPPISQYPVGTSVYLNVGGTAKEFIIVHQGLPSSLYDSSCNGTWLLMKDIYESRYWHSTGINQYADADIHKYLNGDFLALFDTAIQSLIKQVKIPYCRGYGSSTVYTGADGLSTKAFLLSGYEVGFTTNDSPDFLVDGTCLNYFTTYASSKRQASNNWWLRSPKKSDTSTSWLSCYDGTYATNNCDRSSGVRPALILPSDATINPETMFVTT